MSRQESMPPLYVNTIGNIQLMLDSLVNYYFTDDRLDWLALFLDDELLAVYEKKWLKETFYEFLCANTDYDITTISLLNKIDELHYSVYHDTSNSSPEEILLELYDQFKVNVPEKLNNLGYGNEL